MLQVNKMLSNKNQKKYKLEKFAESKKVKNVLDGVQLALDIVGLDPLAVGSAADGTNMIISLLRSALEDEQDQKKRHRLNAAISAASLIPFADLVKVLKLKKLRSLAVKVCRFFKNKIKKEKQSKIFNQIKDLSDSLSEGSEEDIVQAKNWYDFFKQSQNENLQYLGVEVRGKKIYFKIKAYAPGGGEPRYFELFSEEDQSGDALGIAKCKQGLTDSDALKSLKNKLTYQLGVEFTRRPRTKPPRAENISLGEPENGEPPNLFGDPDVGRPPPRHW